MEGTPKSLNPRVEDHFVTMVTHSSLFTVHSVKSSEQRNEQETAKMFKDADRAKIVLDTVSKGRIPAKTSRRSKKTPAHLLDERASVRYHHCKVPVKE